MTRILMILTNTWKLVHSILWSRQILDTISFPKHMQLNQLLVLGAVGQQTWLQLLIQKSAAFFQVLCSISPMKISEILSGAFSCVPCLSLGNWGKPVLSSISYHVQKTQRRSKLSLPQVRSSCPYIDIQGDPRCSWRLHICSPSHLMSYLPASSMWMPWVLHAVSDGTTGYVTRSHSLRRNHCN